MSASFKLFGILSFLFLYSQSLFSAPTIETVYFAQTHVSKSSSPYFILVSERDALIKVHVTEPSGALATPVTATLLLPDSSTDTVTLDGPANFPISIPDGLGVVQHSFDDTFTATIPAAWIKPGLQVTINVSGATPVVETPAIGAPNHITMRMIDVHFFKEASGDYPAGTFDELEAKWPVASLTLNRFTKVIFPELVIPPRSGKPAIRCSSREDYKAQTGINFDGEQGAAIQWNAAMRNAGGTNRSRLLAYVNIYGVPSGGQAGGFSGAGNGTHHGILHHELGHAFNLPHWGDVPSYPYSGPMHGINPPANNNTHAGPIWAYDLPTKTFIPPTVQANSANGHPVGTYKVDPMQGGGMGYQEDTFLLNHFSDYSVFKSYEYIQNTLRVWNPTLSKWARWNAATSDYTKDAVTGNGVDFPIQRNVEVISVMASVSGATPDVNMVYPPVGPYTYDMIKLFDPRIEADRLEAQLIFAPTNGCDVTLRIMQGGTEKYYMLAASWEPEADPLSGASLWTKAVNLPAADGQVTYVELLLTPDAEVNGLPATPDILYTWDWGDVGKITNLQAHRMPTGVYLEWENNWEYTSIKLLRNGSVIESSLDSATTSYLDTSAPSSGDVTYTLIPIRNGFNFDSTEVTITMDTEPLKALIYEPFEDLDPSLTGNTPGTGLTGTWFTRGIFNPNSAQGVSPDSLSYGALTNYAGKTFGTDTGGWPKSSYINTNQMLNIAGLLDHGTELWFSFLIQNGASSFVDFRLGTHGIYEGGPEYQGEAIGVSIDGDLATAAVWNADPTLSVDNGVIPLSAPVLVVGKVTWGADGAAADTIEIYLPDTDLVFPGSPVSTTSAVLDQSLFDTLCFRGNYEDAPQLDEIRFGPDYYSVIAAEDYAPVLLSAASATPAEITVNEATDLIVSAEDPVGRGLTYTWEVISKPVGTTPTLGTPGSDMTSAGSFTAVGNYTFKVTISNGPKSISSNVTVIATSAGNTAPVADSQALTVRKNGEKSITLAGSDADNDPLTYTIVTFPSNGTLTGSAESWTYTPNPDFTGSDAFTFTVKDGEIDSIPAVVSITVVTPSGGGGGGGGCAISDQGANSLWLVALAVLAIALGSRYRTKEPTL